MNTTEWKPMEVGDRDVFRLMPAWDDIPEEFRRERSYWCAIQAEWFFRGLDGRRLREKNGIDRIRALTHLDAIQRSWTPPHEHKAAAVAYLLSLWFDLIEPPVREPKPKRRPKPARPDLLLSKPKSHRGPLKGGLES